MFSYSPENSHTHSGFPQYGHLQWQCGLVMWHCSQICSSILISNSLCDILPPLVLALYPASAGITNNHAIFIDMTRCPWWTFTFLNLHGPFENLWYYSDLFCKVNTHLEFQFQLNKFSGTLKIITMYLTKIMRRLIDQS